MSQNKIAFIGAGLIGSGLAINAITHGIPAAVQIRSQVERTTNSIEAGIASFLRRVLSMRLRLLRQEAFTQLQHLSKMLVRELQ